MYRKFTASKIFDGFRFLPENKVLITSTDGVVEAIVDTKDAGDGIENFEGILCPGFINAHCHLELSHLKKAIPEKTGLVDFVSKIMTLRHFAEDEIFAAIAKAEAEMIQNGIVAVGDICNTAHTLQQKEKQNLHYHNFIEISGFVPATAAKRFESAVAIQELFRRTDDRRRTTDNGPLTTDNGQRTTDDGRRTTINNQRPTINDQPSTTITPHAPYSVSAALFELINQETENKIISIHNQETVAEEDFIKSKTGDFLKLYEHLGIDLSFYQPSGKSSLQTWWPYLNKNQSRILVHNVTTRREDLEWIMGKWIMDNGKQALSGKQKAESGELKAKSFEQRPTFNIQPSTFNLQPSTFNLQPSTFFCLCPNANLYITNCLPDVNMLLELNCNIVLGTDSLASNHQLNILEEIKTLQRHFPKISLETMLRWATFNGARALQLDKKLGSFEKGKEPGVVLIEGQGKNYISKKIL